MTMQSTSFWHDIDEAAGQSVLGSVSLWTWIREKLDLAQYRPQAAPGIVVSQLSGRDGTYYVIKNPQAKTYYRLSERDHFLWQRMEGSQTVKDLVVAYFLEYGSFAFSRVASLVAGLKASHFLSDPPVYLYQEAREQIQRRSPAYRLNQLWQAFMQKQFAIQGLDGFVGGAYRWGGRLLFTWPAQLLMLLVAIGGLALFLRTTGAGTYSLVASEGSVGLGIATLLIANLLAIFLHEMSHALTVKHYGREVRRAGFMIYFGLPAFFVDTTDIWLEGKRARLAVTWAGPHSGLVLAGLAGTALFLWPAAPLNPFLYKFAFLSYLTVFINLNPLLELDGYYILMDWLEIPRLRRKSLDFIRNGLPEKLKAVGPDGKPTNRLSVPPLSSFSREERIFTIFGLLSALWTAYAIYAGAMFWQRRLTQGVSDLWQQGDDLGRLVLALGAIAISLPFVLAIGLFLVSLVGRMARWLEARGLFARIWNVAALLLVAAVALTAMPVLLGNPSLGMGITIAALAAAAYLAWCNGQAYTGSRLASSFRLLALFALALLLQEALRIVSPDGAVYEALEIGLGLLGYLALAAAGLVLFGATNLGDLSGPEKILLVVGLVGSYALAGLMVQQSIVQGLTVHQGLLLVGRALLPYLALMLLVPTLFASWHTTFGPAWGILALALVGLVISALLALPLLPVTLLLAGSIYLHHLAYARLSKRAQSIEALPATALSDRERLGQAFSSIMNSLLIHLQEIVGERQAGLLSEEFNSYALVAGWGVSVINGRVDLSRAPQQPLYEQGRSLAAALSVLLELMSKEMGEKLTVRALQRAYDSMPWELRETGAQYLFRHVKRAEVLSEEFRDVYADSTSLLRQMPLFSTMSDAEIGLLASRLGEEAYRPGHAIIRQGDEGDRFYIVKQGHVEVTVRDERGVGEVVNQLERGDYFGELALLHDVPRTATCRATVPTETLSLSREDFNTLVKDRFAMRAKVDESIARAELLRRIPLFAELDGIQIQYIAACLQEEDYAPGDVIIRQGDIGDTFYVIESGRVQVSVAENGSERVVDHHGSGEYVGEIALLMQVPRTATVTAVEPTQVLAMTQTDFDRLVSEHLYVSRSLEREGSRRMIRSRRVETGPTG